MTNETEIQGRRVKLYRLGRRPYLVEQPQSIVAYRVAKMNAALGITKKL